MDMLTMILKKGFMSWILCLLLLLVGGGIGYVLAKSYPKKPPRFFQPLQIKAGTIPIGDGTSFSMKGQNSTISVYHKGQDYTLDSSKDYFVILGPGNQDFAKLDFDKEFNFEASKVIAVTKERIYAFKFDEIHGLVINREEK